MSKAKNYDPYEGFKQIGEMWEKQLNGLLSMAVDNNVVRLANADMGFQSRYMEMIRKNQEIMASIMNIPTKKDVSNVTNLSLQTEGKIDNLEEHIVKMQECLSSLNKENVELFQEMVKMIKQMQAEFKNAFLEVAELKKLKDEFQEIRNDLVDIKIIQVNLRDVRAELEEIKESQKKMIHLDEQKTILSDIKEVKLGLDQLAELKNEIVSLRRDLVKEDPKDKELVTTV